MLQFIVIVLISLTLTVNDEEPPEAKPLVLLEDPVRPADGHVLVGQQRDLHLSEAAVLPVLLAPGQVGEVGVGGAGDHGAVQGLELGRPVGEGDDLGGADEGEVQRVEEQDHVFPWRDLDD